MRVPGWAWVIWAMGGLVLEVLALANGLTGDSLTENILIALPGWLLYSLLGWLAWHFRRAR